MNEIGSAIWAHLVGGTALTALLADGTAGIFEYNASQGADLPYVIYNHQSGNWDYSMDGQGGTAARYGTFLYQVRAVSGSAYPKQAQLIDKQIDARLHDASVTISGYGLMRIVRETDVRFPEVEGDQTFHHVGALYRVDVQKT